MKDEQDYKQDIAEIRSMMERSTKFLSLSGLAGIMAGIYALAGAFIADAILDFNPQEIDFSVFSSNGLSYSLPKIIFLGIVILTLTIGTAIFLSYKKARKKGEKIWNDTAKRLVVNMAVPLIAGGVLILILISKGIVGLMAPITLIFYGIALFTSGKFTYQEMKSLGLIEIGLGLLGSYFIEYGLLLWAIGFGAVHIIYGIYMHYKYER